MRTLDASAILHGWDNYPLENFPRLWEWMAERIRLGDLTIADVTLEEVGHREPECAEWLKGQGVQVLPLNDETLAETSRLKQMLQIQGEAYHPQGVGETDLVLMATARILGVDLITNEQRQPTLPNDMRRYKLPAVGALLGVNVRTLSFLDYLKLHQVVFG